MIFGLQRVVTASLVLVSAAFASAGGPGLLTVRDLTVKADVVVLGKVVTVLSQWNAARTQIVTRVELLREQVLKGNVPGDHVSFIQPGGRVGEVGSVAAESPSFTIGERVIVFLLPRRDGQLGIVGLFQGKFTIEPSSGSGFDMAVRHLPGSAQTTEQMTLEQLRSEVQTALGN